VFSSRVIDGDKGKLCHAEYESFIFNIFQETQLEQKKADRHGLLKSCKVRIMLMIMMTTFKECYVYNYLCSIL
jgi:hypothetical protein